MMSILRRVHSYPSGMTVYLRISPEAGVDLAYAVSVSAATDYVSVPDGRCGVVLVRGRLWWLGPSTRPWVLTGPVGSVIGVRLSFVAGVAGGGGGALRGWRDRRVPLATIWGPEQVGRMEQCLAHGENSLLADALAHLVSERVHRSVVQSTDTQRLLEMLTEGARVSEIAADLSISPRQVLRRCNDNFGMAPSTLRRVLRLHLAAGRWVAQPQSSLTVLASESGYADEAHLAREARALTTTTMRDAVAVGVRFVQDGTREALLGSDHAELGRDRGRGGACTEREQD